MKRPSKRKIKVQSAFVEMSSVFVMLRDISGKVGKPVRSVVHQDWGMAAFVYLFMVLGI